MPAPSAGSSEIAQGQGRRRRHHPLHVGHDRPAQGRDAVARQRHHVGAERQRLRQARPRATRRSPICRWPGSATIFSYAQALCRGLLRNCPETPRPWCEDRREIGPTYIFAPPRVFENLLTRPWCAWRTRAALKRRHVPLLPRRGAGAGARRSSTASRCRCRRRLLYGSGNLLVYAPLQEPLGLSRMRVGYTAGEAIGPEIFQLLPLARHQSEAALRPDRSLGLHHRCSPTARSIPTRSASRRRTSRSGSPTTARCCSVARRLPGLLQGPGRDRRDQDAGRLGAHRRRRLLRPSAGT